MACPESEPLSAATSINGVGHDPATEGKDPDAIARGYMAKALSRAQDKREKLLMVR